MFDIVYIRYGNTPSIELILYICFIFLIILTFDNNFIFVTFKCEISYSNNNVMIGYSRLGFIIIPLHNCEG